MLGNRVQVWECRVMGWGSRAVVWENIVGRKEVASDCRLCETGRKEGV